MPTNPPPPQPGGCLGPLQIYKKEQVILPNRYHPVQYESLKCKPTYLGPQVQPPFASERDVPKTKHLETLSQT